MRLIEALGEVSTGAELRALQSQSSYLWDDERRISFMDEHGFDKQVLVLARPPVWLGMERTELHRLTRVANDSLAEFASRRSDRFLSVGVLPVVDDDMMEEFERIHGELGLCGVLIFSNIEGKPLDHDSMWPLYERAAALGLPIWIHPQHANIYPWIGRDVLDRTLAWPFDTSLAMARLVFGGVFEKYPDIRFVTHHMGGMIPYFAPRIDAFARSTAVEYARLGIGGSSGAVLTGPAIDHFPASTTTRSATAPSRPWPWRAPSSALITSSSAPTSRSAPRTVRGLSTNCAPSARRTSPTRTARTSSTATPRGYSASRTDVRTIPPRSAPGSSEGAVAPRKISRMSGFSRTSWASADMTTSPRRSM